jgi:hypothetical protein
MTTSASMQTNERTEYTASQWTTLNPVLLLGAYGIETDTGKAKQGDGVTAWASLDYIGDAVVSVVSDVAYNATSWNGVGAVAPSKNAVRDQLEVMIAATTAAVSDTAYNATTWDAVTTIAPSKNAMRDQVEVLVAALAAAISDVAYDATSWNGVTGVAPSKNAVRDQVEVLITAIAATVAQTITNGVTTSAPSQDVVFDALALKANAADPSFTGTTLTLADAQNIVANATTGTQIGTATSQKLGLWATPPIIQPARAGQLTDNSGGTGGGNTIAAITGAVDPTAATIASTANAIATLAARLNVVEAKLSTAGGGIGVTA